MSTTATPLQIKNWTLRPVDSSRIRFAPDEQVPYEYQVWKGGVYTVVLRRMTPDGERQISVSAKHKFPTYDEIAQIRDQFWDPDVAIITAVRPYREINTGRHWHTIHLEPKGA